MKARRSDATARCSIAIAFVAILTALFQVDIQAADDPDRYAMIVDTRTDLAAHPQPLPWTDSRCDGCHQVDRLWSHPVDVTPSIAIPNQFPLDAGRLTCVTCHDNDVDAHLNARANHKPLLRGSATGAAFCAQCHNPLQPTRAAQHGSAIAKAHLRWADRLVEKPSPTRSLDSESENCLTCHDGTIAIGIRGSRLTGVAWDDSEHAVGEDYDATGVMSVSNRDNMLRSMNSLDSRIRLFNGRVGCNSCHSPYSAEKYLLVMPNDGSRLCLSCHQM